MTTGLELTQYVAIYHSGTLQFQQC